jgi:predicted CXXCH cytochrome family protein
MFEGGSNMKLRTKLLHLAAFLVIALPVLTGNAEAGYLTDGAVQHPVNGGWITPNDMVCILGVHTDGTVDLVPGVTNGRQCIYYNTGLTGMNPIDVTGTSTCGTNGTLACNVAANCTGTNPIAKGTLTWNSTDNKCYNSAPCTVAGYAGNDGAKHALATSICVDGGGNGIPLTDLDRTAQMCAALGGTWKQTSATAPSGFAGTFPTPNYGGSCVAYSRQFRGQDDNGTPLAFGTEGTSAFDAGFCYAPLNMTTKYPTSTVCPASDNLSHPSAGFDSSTAYDWSFASSKCTYAKGIKGYLNAALTKANGTTYAAGAFLDLSAFTTMGQCLANGGNWNNWVGQPASTTSVATTPLASTIPAWDFTRQAPETTQGCLHCHSTLTQYNGPAERFKDTYLYQGHKNMLRKVTPGKSWAGPNADGDLEHYTDAATGPIDFSAATAGICSVSGKTTPAACTDAGGTWSDRPLLYIFGDWMAPAPAGLDVIVDMGPGVGAKYNGTSNYSCAACHTTGWSNSTAGLCSLSSKTTSGACTGAGGTWYPLVGVEGIGTPGFTPAEPAASFSGITFTGAGKWDLEGIRCPRCHNVTAPKVVDTQIAASAYPSTHVTSGGMGALADGVGRTNLCFGCHQSIAKTNNGIGLDADLSHPENIPVKNAATAPDYLPEFNGHVIGNSFLNSVHGQFTGKIVPNALGKYDLEDTTGNNNGNASKYASKFQGYTCWQSPTSSSPAKTMIVGGVIKEIKTKTDCETLYGAGSWRTDTQGTCVTCHDVHNSLFVKETKEAALRKVCTDCHNKSLAHINHLDGPGTPLGYLAGTAEAWEACVTCHMPKATSSGFPMHLWRINTKADYRTFPTATEFLGIPDVALPTKKIANAAPDGPYTNAVWVDLDYVCGQCHGGSFGPTATKNGAPYFLKSELSQYAKDMHRNAAPNPSCTENISGRTVTLTDSSTDDSIFPDNAITVKWGDGTSSKGNAGSVFSHTYAKAKKYRIVHSVKDSQGVTKVHRLTVTVK